MKGYKLKRAKASFTIEAALIMPIVLFVIVALIYTSFYLYDWCRLRAIADIALHKAVVTIKHEADFNTGRVDYEHINDRGVFFRIAGSSRPDEDKTRNYLTKELQRGFFCTEIRDVQVTIEKRNITVHISGEFNVPMKGIMEYVGSHKRMEVTVDSPTHDPAELLRMMDVIMETGEKIKGLNQLMNWIDQKSNN